MGLNALADNGGPVLPTGALLTRLPEDDSPAVNTGNAAIETSLPANDQRGPGFARVSGTALDIGAIEIPVPPLPATGSAVPTWFPVVGGVVFLLGIGAVVFAVRQRRRIEEGRPTLSRGPAAFPRHPANAMRLHSAAPGGLEGCRPCRELPS